MPHYLPSFYYYPPPPFDNVPGTLSSDILIQFFTYFPPQIMNLCWDQHPVLRVINKPSSIRMYHEFVWWHATDLFKEQTFLNFMASVYNTLEMFCFAA